MSSNDDSSGDTDEHKLKLQELRASLGEIDSDVPDAPLRRYLVARDWNVQEAKEMMDAILLWKFRNVPNSKRGIALDRETLDMFRGGFFDQHGRMILILRPAFKDLELLSKQFKYLLYVIETVVIYLREGQEQMFWVIDLAECSLPDSSASACLEFVNVLLNNYPERLAEAYMCNPSPMFLQFWMKVRSHLEAPKTIEKLTFIDSEGIGIGELLRHYFNGAHLPVEYGGLGKLCFFGLDTLRVAPSSSNASKVAMSAPAPKPSSSDSGPHTVEVPNSKRPRLISDSSSLSHSSDDISK